MKTVEELTQELEAAAAQLTEANTKISSLDERAKRFEGLVAEKEQGLAKFKDVDPDKYRATLEEIEILKREKVGIDEDTFNTTLQEKMQEERTEFQKQLDAYKGQVEGLVSEANQLKINEQAWPHLKHVKKDMIPFVKELVKKHGIIEEDKLLAVDADGNKLTSKEDLTKLMEWPEFVKQLEATHPSMFEKQIPVTNHINGTRTNGSTNGGMSLVDKLQNPETAKNMSPEDRRKAGFEAAKKYRI